MLWRVSQPLTRAPRLRLMAQPEVGRVAAPCHSSAGMGAAIACSPTVNFTACWRCNGEGSLFFSKKRSNGERTTPQSRPCTACKGVGLLPSSEKSGKESARSKFEAEKFKEIAASSLPIAIAGGGIGGAALALALQQRSIPVVVYERDGSFAQRAQGYALTMQQGANALKLLGLRNEGVFSHTHHSFTSAGELLGRYGRAVHEKTKHQMGNGRGDSQRRNAHLPRQQLRAALLSAVTPSTIRWGQPLSHFEATDEGVTLHFGSGQPPERAAMLVGADGIHSTVARALRRLSGASSPCATGSSLLCEDAASTVTANASSASAEASSSSFGEGLSYLGVVVLLGRARCDHALAREQVFQSLDGETRIFVMPFCDEPQTSMWQLSFPLSAAEAAAMSRSGASLKAEAMRRCGGWHAPIPQLLNDTDPDDITGYPAFDREPWSGMHRCSADGSTRMANVQVPRRVTLLGDAAHPMSPFKGQGANQALVDAVTLARALRRSSMFGGRVPLDETLDAYEADMLRRAKAKVYASREAVPFLHSAAALAQSNCTRAAAARAAANEAP